MKNRIAITLSSLSLLGTSAAFASGEHDHKPAHGCIVTEVKEIQYELIAREDSLQFYVTDHDKPVKLDGTKAAASVSLAGKSPVSVRFTIK